MMHDDFERCYHAVQSRNTRFDGWFVTAVRTTGIYCRPSCSAGAPRPENLAFYPTAAAAQQAGFRACKRCRPDAAPGSPEWGTRDDAVARAMRLIADGVVDREGVSGLAGRLGYSTHQVQRLLHDEVGAGPLALARAQRARTARALLEATDLSLGDVAFAAGFSSTHQFNDTVQMVYATTPRALRDGLTRGRGRNVNPGGETGGPEVLLLRLPVRLPFAYRSALGHLAASATPGCEEVRNGAFRRTLRLPRGSAIVELTPATDHVRCLLRLDDLRDLTSAVNRCRRLLDLDADPVAVIDALSTDPVLRPIVAAAPGQRIPRTVDEQELAIRVVLGQQVSIKAARTHTARLLRAYGTPISDPRGDLTHVFPSISQLAAISPDHLAMPQSRRRSLLGLISGLGDGSIVVDSGCDWEATRRQLLAVPGIGPWTTEVIAMRGLGDPDAFPVTDLGVRVAAERLGLPSDPGGLTAHAKRWCPWRSYATQHLWTTLDHAINEWPPREQTLAPVKDPVKEPSKEIA